MIWTAITGLAGNIVNGIIDNRNKKQEIKDAKHAREVKAISDENNAAGRNDDISLSNVTWEDGYLTILITSPFVLLFIDPFLYALLKDQGYDQGFMAQSVNTAFQTMENVPEYMQYALALVVIHTFGYKRILRPAIVKFSEIMAKRMIK